MKISELYYEKQKEKIDKQFDKLLYKMSDDEFWTYVRSWYSEETLVEIMFEWDMETKKQAIKEMKEIMLKKVKGGKLKNGKK